LKKNFEWVGLEGFFWHSKYAVILAIIAGFNP